MRSSSATVSSQIASSITQVCSAGQITDASKVFEISMSTTAMRNVGAAVDVDGRVAGADAHAGLARLVCGGDRLGTAGRPDEVDALVVEQVLRDVERRVGDHLEGVGRQPRGLAGLLEDLDRPFGAACGPRRRPEDDRVARLRRDDRLEQHGGGRVRDRREREHDADRLGHVLDAALGVLVDHPNGALVLQVVVEELGRDVVLDDLVLEHAEAGLLHRELGELDGVPQAGHDHRPDDPVDLLLVQLPKARRGCLGALDVPVEPLGERRVNDSPCSVRGCRSCGHDPRA